MGTHGVILATDRQLTRTREPLGGKPRFPCDAGRRRRETLQQREVDRRRANRLGLAANSARHRLDRLCPGAVGTVAERTRPGGRLLHSGPRINLTVKRASSVIHAVQDCEMVLIQRKCHPPSRSDVVGITWREFEKAAS